MRQATAMVLALLVVGGIGVMVGRSIAPPAPPLTRPERERSLGLDRVVADVRFDQTPLTEAIETLGQKAAAKIDVRWKVLEAAGIDANAPVTLRASNLPLKRVLDLLCEEAGGGTVKLATRGEDGTIVLSTADDNGWYGEMRLYDVRDLTRAAYDNDVSIGWRPTTQPAGGGGKSLFSGGMRIQDPHAQAIEDLTRIIMEYVAPDMWRDAGGTVGSIREFNGRLVIIATPAMHDQIAEVLELIRRGGK